MKNIEEFNIAVGEIFGACYSEFPKPTRVYKIIIGKAIKDGMGVEYDPDYTNLDEHEYKVVEHALSWLIRAGYIWEERDSTQSSSQNIRLSPLGLEVLKAVPDALQVKESIGEQLSKGVKSLGKEVLSTAVSTALSIGLNSVGSA